MKEKKPTDIKDCFGHKILVGDICAYKNEDRLFEVTREKFEFRMWHTDQEIEGNQRFVPPVLYSQQEVYDNNVYIYFRDNKRFEPQKSLF